MTDDALPRTIGVHVSGQKLVWGHPSLWTFIADSSFTDCDITIACSARGIGLKDCLFRNCSILAQRPLSNAQWFDIAFEDCRFIGKYPGCEFGYRAPGYQADGQQGYVRGCDFSRAELSFVTINSSDVSTIALPPWPHFAVLRSAAFSEIPAFQSDSEWQLLAGLPWPEERKALVHRYVHGGKRGFSLPLEQAREVLTATRSIRVQGAAQQSVEADEGS
jgi:hypothetical protein